jgi:LmbE family N-acetylglucosaminyl deacetylase
LKTFMVNVEWLFKGRYPLHADHRVTASGVRAAVGKALAAKRKGYREVTGATLRVRVTCLGNGINQRSSDQNGVD